MLQVDVSARVRENRGKEASRNLRKEGKSPAILYGPDTEPIALEINTKDLTKTLLSIQRRNCVANLAIEGQDKRYVMIKEIQAHPVHDTLLHTDFYEISIDKPQAFKVPVTYKGKAAGVEMGGDMLTYVDEVRLEGKPLDIPDSIEVDISSVGLDEQIACGDLKIPEGVKMLEKADKVCMSVSAPVIAA